MHPVAIRVVGWGERRTPDPGTRVYYRRDGFDAHWNTVKPVKGRTTAEGIYLGEGYVLVIFPLDPFGNTTDPVPTQRFKYMRATMDLPILEDVPA